MSAPNAALATLEAAQHAKVAESLVLRGDISLLTAQERVTYYLQMCQQLGLNPSAQPFTFLKLNGKELLYAGRGCTDQLARIHGVTRELLDQPKVIDIAGTKVVYAVCKATLPNGRSETATATLPLADPAMVFMKVETKAKRRATLALLGLALLDETEVHDIPAAAKEELPQLRSDAVGATMCQYQIAAPNGDEEPENDPERSVGSRTWAAYVLAMPTLRTAAAVAGRYLALPQDLREEGCEAPEEYLTDKDGPGALSLAREALARLGHRLAKDESAQVVQNLALASLLDTQAAITTLDAAVAWWRAQRATTREMGHGPAETAFYALGRRLAAEITPAATKAAVKALKLAVEAADKGPGPDGPKGGAKPPAAAKTTTANGSAAASSQGDGATALVSPEVIRWRDHLAAKAPRGADKGAAAIAGAYWKHCTGDGELAALPAAQRSLAYSAVLDELSARGISEPHSFLDEIGVKNGALARRAA